MFAILKLFPKDGAVARAVQILLRWGTGIVITVCGFQAVYTLLLTEVE